jgi:hypothetical protein
MNQPRPAKCNYCMNYGTIKGCPRCGRTRAANGRQQVATTGDSSASASKSVSKPTVPTPKPIVQEGSQNYDAAPAAVACLIVSLCFFLSGLFKLLASQ